MSEKQNPAWRRYLRFWGRDVAADVDDELAFHLDQRITELVGHGLNPALAREQAVRRMGNVGVLKEVCRAIGDAHVKQVRRRDWLSDFSSDVRIGARQLLHSPMLTFVAVITLALGIGANTAIFSLLYSVVMRPLPFIDADRMTQIAETVRGSDTRVGPAQYHEWALRNRTFENLSAHLNTSFNLTHAGPAERVGAAWVTPSFFQVRYAQPMVGRYFRPEEGLPGGAKVAVISHRLFQQRFGGDGSLIGRTIELDQQPYLVIGVTPPSYDLAPERELLWVPLVLTAEHTSNFDQQWLVVHGKLLPGITLADAQRDLERVTAEIAKEQPASMRDRSVRIYDFRADLVSAYNRQLTVLFGAVGFVLVLAWFNVANLLLARVTTRRKEIAIRAALGASRGRLVRQFLAEALVIAALSGSAALLVARLTVRQLISIAPSGIPRLADAGKGAHLVVFLIGITLVSAAFLGLLSAVRGTRNLQPTLRQGGRSSSVSSTRDPLRSVLVISEVALALVLLTGAGLFVRTALALQRIDPGFDSRNVLTARLSFSGDRYTSSPQLIASFTQVLERARALPGAEVVSATSQLPLDGGGIELGLRVDGRVFAPGQAPRVAFRAVSPDYFDALRIGLERGRAFNATDRAGALPVAIVNETLAARLWPGDNPIGKRVSCCGAAGPGLEVVGVSADVRHSLTREPQPELFVPFQQMPPDSWIWLGNALVLTVRTQSTPTAILPGLREAVASVDPGMPLYDVRTLDQLLTRATATNRFSLILFTTLAVLALVLATVGIYGVLAYFVGQRTQEIGVRVALGARRADVIALIMRQGGRLTITGLVIGLFIAVIASRALTAMLYGITPMDPLTYIAVSALLGGIALLACYVPARHAAAVDPATSIRA